MGLNCRCSGGALGSLFSNKAKWMSLAGDWRIRGAHTHTIGLGKLRGWATRKQFSTDLPSKHMEQLEVRNKQEGLTPDIVSKPWH